MSNSDKAVKSSQAKTLYDDLRNRHEGVKESIAPEYADLTFPVTAGAHCFHEGVYYRAKQNIQTSEAWNPAHWETDAIEAELSSLKSAINDNKHTITEQSESANSFSKEELAEYGDDYNIVCDATGYNTVAVALSEDFCPITDPETIGMFSKLSGNTLTINGTTSAETPYYTRVGGNATYEPKCEIKNGDTVTIAVYVEGSITGSSFRDSRLEVQLLDANNGKQYLWVDIANTGLNTATFTANRDVANINVYIRLYSGYTFNNVKVTWCGINSANGFNSVPVVDNVVRYTKEQVGNNGFSIFPPDAYVKNVANLKNYVDTHIPSDMLTDADLVYLSPEMYGAVGDGIADDSTAVQACIDDAISNHKVVRGFGRYKILSGLTIDGTQTDIFLNEITYTGTSTAVTLAGTRNRFKFNTIYAQSTGANCIGVVNSSQENIDTQRLVIDGIALYANNYAISIDPSNNGYILYVVAHIKSIHSATSDAIHTTGYPGEIAVYDAYFACVNGWAFNGYSIKLYNCTIEGNCYGAVYAHMCLISGGRFRELMDTLMPANPKHDVCSGLIYKFKSVSPSTYTGTAATVSITIPDNVFYDAIDLSEFSDIVLPHSGDYTFYLGYIGTVDRPIVYGDANYSTGYLVIGEKMILHAGNKICKPCFPLVHTVETADFDMRDSAENHLPYATVFNIDVADCVIKLAPSYCAMGYNDIIISQPDSTKLATVYNNNGDKIFDGATLGVGRYRLTAICDPSADPDRWGTMVYNSGNMDVWTVEKIG